MGSQELQETAVHVQRTLRRAIVLTGAALVLTGGCASFPEPKFEKHEFPEDAYVGDIKRAYEPLGLVRSKVDYPSLDPARDEEALCANYYNKAVEDLVRRARKMGGDAVIDVKSVVFLADGRRESYPTPECADDGAEGQVLTQGIAIKWKRQGLAAEEAAK